MHCCRSDDRDDYRDDDRYRRRGRDYYEEDYDEDYDNYDDDNGIDEQTKLLMIRIASVVTGLLILMFLVFIVKAKFIDKVASPDSEKTSTESQKDGDDDKDDEEGNGDIDIPEGYDETNDKVVVNYEFLNLRSSPSTSSDIVTKAKEGDELKRIAVSNDGSWALINYKGKAVYASMDYLSVNP